MPKPLNASRQSPAEKPILLQRTLRVLLAAVVLSSSLPAPLRARLDKHSEVCSTYPDRVIHEMALHQQHLQASARLRLSPLRDLTTVPIDVGYVAVLPDDGTLVAAQNPFDLDGRTLTFTPLGSGYTVSAGGMGFDSVSADAGDLLNPPPAGNPANIGDDGSQLVSLPFSFRFFGQSYGTAFVNSDGNLTFGQGDNASTDRSLSRFLGGPPRISPFFADLDPSFTGRLTVYSSPSVFIVSWIGVPDFASSGTGPRETFQAALYPDGRIVMAYNGISGREAVVGIAAGNLNTSSAAIDLSGTSGGVVIHNSIAEVFSITNELDVTAVAKRFYQTHDDAYQYLVIFTNFDFNMNGAFAFELNIANQVTGIGRIGNRQTFDFSNQFGSAGRLESLLNMGNLARYPADPNTVFLRGVDSTLSVMGQETGHRFLSYITWADPAGSAGSTELLGRDLAHWSFYFNSDASVVEGNQIRDNSNGTFTTTGAVQRYSDLDQYLMGLRGPNEVAPTFLVKNPSPALNPGTAPALNVTFSGARANVVMDHIIASNGPRLPSSEVAPKRYNFAFILVNSRNSPATGDQIAKVDRIRREWESFYNRAVSFRGTANTSLVRSLRLQPGALGLLNGGTATGKITLGATASAPVNVRLTNSNPGAVRVQDIVTVPAGAVETEFLITAVGPGRATLEAAADGFETGAAVIETIQNPASTTLTMQIAQGNNQTGPTGGLLPSVLQVRLRDANQTPFAGLPVRFSVVSGSATVSANPVLTNSSGIAETQVQLGNSAGPIRIAAAVTGSNLQTAFSATAVDGPFVSPAGIVSGASFQLAGAAVSPGGIISIFGSRLANGTASAASLPLPTTLGESRVELNGVPLSLFFVSPNQINAQAPADASTGTQQMVVRSGGGASPAIPVALRRAAPGIFTINSSGSGPGAITHAITGAPVSPASPAVPGEFVSVFATGLGTVVPAVSSGQPAPSSPVARTTLPVAATVGGRPASVGFAGLAPGFAGLYQVNLQVPELSAGTAEVVLSVDGVSSNAVTMEVSSR